MTETENSGPYDVAFMISQQMNYPIFQKEQAILSLASPKYSLRGPSELSAHDYDNEDEEIMNFATAATMPTDHDHMPTGILGFSTPNMSNLIVFEDMMGILAPLPSLSIYVASTSITVC